jgi:hypothetical protein
MPQSNWRWCWTCEALFYAGGNVPFPNFAGSCPNGQGLHGGHYHDGTRSQDYTLDFASDGVGPGQQSDWMYCWFCGVLFYTGNAFTGHCPNSGGAIGGFSFRGHIGRRDPSDPSTASSIYVLRVGDPHPAPSGWRWCQKCAALFFAGNMTSGACPAGGGHDGRTSTLYLL